MLVILSPAPMSEGVSADGAASTPASNYELDCGEVHLKAQNVPERVQLLLLSTLSLAVVGALSIGAWALAQNSRYDSREDS
ncbi:hypothetical protein ACFCZY_08480 [Streptomyces sp. NPDC056237]|uniref:hypothetical protein n=1 Tax=unclassified Streptomyces TaxID=2593676 RepID=UPI0035E0DE00